MSSQLGGQHRIGLQYMTIIDLEKKIIEDLKWNNENWFFFQPGCLHYPQCAGGINAPDKQSISQQPAHKESQELGIITYTYIPTLLLLHLHIVFVIYHESAAVISC